MSSMSALFLNQSKRILYFSSGVYASVSFFSSSKTNPQPSSTIFTNYLDKSYNNFQEKFEQSTDKRNSCKILSELECRQIFSMSDAIRIQGEAFTSMYNKETIVPSRIILSIPNNKSNNDDTLFKPSVNNNILGEKVVSVRPKNPSLFNLPSITGCIILWNKETGLTNCLMDASFITGRRTAAGSGLATDLFAISNIQQLTIFGAGTQASEHIKTVLTVRNLPKIIYIINRSIENADKLKEKLLNELNIKQIEIKTLTLKEFHNGQYDKYKDVISNADIICTCTNSEKPLFDGKMLKKGVHINAVGGYKPNMIELDEIVSDKCYIFVDSIHAFYAGDLYKYFNVDKDNEELNGVWKSNGNKWREIGEYIVNDIGKNGFDSKKFGKPINEKYENQMTLFKSVGVAAQDLHSAYFVYDNAVKNNIGTDVCL